MDRTGLRDVVARARGHLGLERAEQLDLLAELDAPLCVMELFALHGAGLLTMTATEVQALRALVEDPSSGSACS